MVLAIFLLLVTVIPVQVQVDGKLPLLGFLVDVDDAVAFT